ncbi:MAG: ABC transporter permease, partial [Chitinophagaceae bacterium]
MIKNYLKVAWRNLAKNKVFSLINILGLTIGITVCMMIFLFIMNEFSFDKFHTKGENIYRVMRGYDRTKNKVPYLSGPYATALLNDFPGEIKKAVRVMTSNDLISFSNTSFNEKKVYIADPDFFSLFSFPLLRGNASAVLKEPGSVVLTEKTAKKYFGSIDQAMGKVVEMNKNRQLKVTGIAKNVPSNSHLDFDLVIPLSHYYNEPWFKVWINNNNFTYVLLDEKSSKAKLERQFPQFMEKYMGKDMARMGAKFELALTPLTDIYFEPSSSFDNVRHGDKKVVYIFLSVAVFILLIACINFMNLSTIRAVERSKEVGLRKVMGALRNHLVWQFIGESILLTFIACLLSVGLLQLLMPLYSGLLGYSLTVSWTAMPIYLFLAGVILVVGFLAGSYPAFFLSVFSPIQALKGKLRLGKGGAFFRQALVVVQFSISVFLIIGTIIIMSQMKYVKEKELGYDKEHSIIIPIDNGDFYDNRISFKNNLQSKSNIVSVSMMSGEPGGFFDMHSFEAEGQPDVWKARTEFADFEYVKTLGLKIIAGRDLSSQYATDTTDAVLINRT